MNKPSEPTRRFSYADYEAAVRRPHYATLQSISTAAAARLSGCQSVLDIASGQGLLLDALRAQNVPACGVDSEPNLVRECRERGLDVTEDDVLRFLQATTRRFDGGYCGHLIEHLPYDALLDLMEGTARVLSPDGLFILRWPNPRAAVAHLALYWKDPTHRWFYDGELIEAILQFYGFAVEEAHYDTVAPRGAILASSVALPTPRKGARGLADGAFRRLQNLSRKQAPALLPLVTRLETRITARSLDRQARLAFRLPTEAQIVARRLEGDPS